MTSNKNNCILNDYDEELDYEYSDYEDEAQTVYNQSSTIERSNRSANSCYDSDESQINLKLRRVNISSNDIQSSHRWKRQWRRHNILTGYLKRWRIRSFDLVFSLRDGAVKNKLQQWVEKQKLVSVETEVNSEEIEDLSFFSIVINNDLYTVKNHSTVPDTSSTKQVPYKTWDPWQPLPFSLFS